MYKLGLEKAEETEIKLQLLLDHRESNRIPENLLFCFIDYTNAFDCVDHNKMENSLRDGNTRLSICLPRNLYAGQEATARTLHGTTNWLKIGKGVGQGCLLSPCLFKFYAEYSSEMPGWMNPKLESRLLGEILTTSDAQMIPL